MAGAERDDAWVTVARIARTQGCRGELAADLHTDFPDRFAPQGQVWLLRAGGARQAFTIRHSWMHQGRVVLGLEGIEDMTVAAGWRGAEVQVPREQRRAAPEGSYYLSDLVGCEVFDRGRAAGKVAAVETMPGAAAMLDLGRECLVPFVEAFLDRVDLGARRIDMHLPEGLLEINERAAGAEPAAAANAEAGGGGRKRRGTTGE